ncbi:hypothetical protein [Dactylosporangium sp. CA-233914]|uniref:hypothetical protein n=1 Tax=Dactylosporangium sp. CA-233914 TaxID=3239934 RepID=UPI003D93EF31
MHMDGAGGYVRRLVWLQGADAVLDPVPALTIETFADHEPFLLAVHGGSCAVIADPTELWLHTDPGREADRIPITDAELVAAVTPPPRLQGGNAVSADGTFSVVFSHGILTQERRYVADLELDTGHRTARWTSAPRPLHPDDFPHDRFGDDAFDDDVERAVSLTASLRRDGLLTICSEGSDLGSMNRYGADFFTVATIASDGSVAERLWERAGWKRQPGKHGLHGRFTADGEYVILTPNFRTGEWKGRQRLLRLDDRQLLAPRMPRGRTTAAILDGSNGRWWLEHDGTLLAVDDLGLAGA